MMITALAACGVLLCLPPTPAIAAETTPSTTAAARTAVKPQELEHAIGERTARVEEFRFIRQVCEQLKVRCWLFGGTAAGYGHYVKWDLLREAGDKRFQPDRFDYDYTNIFRSTQDADLVIDGPPEAAAQLEAMLTKEFPHLQGSKSVWEVRLLRQARGDKEALLGNPDFLGQHTDSNSTGMIEITRPKPGESVVRDLRDWTPAPGKHPVFFEDIREGKLHYYFSKTHGATNRARLGMNPPILSVIRYLTKAFQYELEVKPEDWRVIEQLIQSFDPARDLVDPYVKNWIEKNGKKLIQHAVNIEYALDTLERLGLRQKLMAGGDLQQLDSLAWWLNREPLRTRPLGTEGRTARELGIEVVGHETRNFLAYESITRAHTGAPNVLISRDHIASEAAAYGDGFYAAVGKKGAAGTGLTIRFEVHPDAREGVDFIRAEANTPTAQTGEFIVFRNKSALRVIPESLNFTPVQFIRFLASGESLDQSDTGLIEKLRRRIGAKAHRIPPADLSEMVSFINERSAATNDPVTLRKMFSAVMEFLRYPGAEAYFPPVKLAGLVLQDPSIPPAIGKLRIEPFVAADWWKTSNPLIIGSEFLETLSDHDLEELVPSINRRAAAVHAVKDVPGETAAFRTLRDVLNDRRVHSLLPSPRHLLLQLIGEMPAPAPASTSPKILDLGPWLSTARWADTWNQVLDKIRWHELTDKDLYELTQAINKRHQAALATNDTEVLRKTAAVFKKLMQEHTGNFHLPPPAEFARQLLGVPPGPEGAGRLHIGPWAQKLDIGSEIWKLMAEKVPWRELRAEEVRQLMPLIQQALKSHNPRGITTLWMLSSDHLARHPLMPEVVKDAIRMCDPTRGFPNAGQFGSALLTTSGWETVPFRARLVQTAFENMEPQAASKLYTAKLANHSWTNKELRDAILQNLVKHWHAATKDRHSFPAAFREAILADANWAYHPQSGSLLTAFLYNIGDGEAGAFLKQIEAAEAWRAHPNHAELRLKTRSHLLEYPFPNHTFWETDPEGPMLLKIMLRRNRNYHLTHSYHVDTYLAEVLSRPFWARHPEGIDLVKELIRKPRNFSNFNSRTVLVAIGERILPESEWIAHPRALEILEALGGPTDMEGAYSDSVFEFAGKSLAREEWASKPGFFKTLEPFMDRWEKQVVPKEALLEPKVLRQPGAVDLLRLMAEKSPFIPHFAQRYLNKPEFLTHSDAIEAVRPLLKNPDYHYQIAQEIFSNPAWAKVPASGDALLQLIEGRHADGDIVWHVLKHEEWARHPQGARFMEALIGLGTMDADIDRLLHEKEFWASHPALRKACGGGPPSVASLREAFSQGLTFKNVPAASGSCVARGLGTAVR